MCGSTIFWQESIYRIGPAIHFNYFSYLLLGEVYIFHSRSMIFFFLEIFIFDLASKATISFLNLEEVDDLKQDIVVLSNA